MTVTATWDEPAGATPRGTLVVLPGRGETDASYHRFGRRLSADAYKVRLVDVDLDDLTATRERVEKVLADESLPSPKVLVGADTGATLAATLVGEVPADAAVLAGLTLPGSAVADSWEEQVEARTACPVHRAVLDGDLRLDREARDQPLPWTSVELTAPDKPVLVVHGSADRITAAAEATAPYVDAPGARVWLVEGGRHDILNDVSHRSVAATVVLFLESLKLGAELPPVLVPVSAPAGATR
ncbi:alpha/beta hydrolase [Nocardioides hwasunensis]|uniref:Alpha/beta hydrolase n=1 Tax=Nocardioides hwasunensis TaxID=397258 RepID=A0ABR8MLY1_9ACTN|nr:alpha/beta hydrolase [Nocardioides hwasunensis]MBD3916953.1 alpha/beta hydrolase [Nocardioides hwasunensis]